MGKGRWIYSPKKVQDLCVICRTPFKGAGDRCPQHLQQLIARRRRKPR
jgi:hypothetical protein